MVRQCVVCGSPQTKYSSYSFHRIPTVESKRAKWLKACGLEHKSISKYSVICSQHFAENDYDEHHSPKRTLLPSAVPSSVHVKQEFQFTFIKVEDTQNAESEMLIKCESHNQISDFNLPHVSTDVQNPAQLEPEIAVRYPGDLQVSHFETPRKAKRHLEFVMEVIEGQRKKIRLLHTQNQRLNKKITSFATLLADLKEKKLMSNEAHDAIKVHFKLT
ncbi:hypothetical protein Zmor_015833 [Zophobas morio]|uniref:THAP-type domain-containing protein n=1 Tax=Zophobas morio TaxID=2755281 RepID=A0AA38IIV2_9CUCU|nr:hypothetical protein Zmor_014739 [Zophobas morio]KAJ3656785.1 hypothetical protein Zmor_015833 [Zophobas morio]